MRGGASDGSGGGAGAGAGRSSGMVVGAGGAGPGARSALFEPAEDVDEGVLEVALLAVELDDPEAVADHAARACRRPSRDRSVAMRIRRAAFAGFDELDVGLRTTQSETACGLPMTWTS